jgi:hypothetical protein
MKQLFYSYFAIPLAISTIFAIGNEKYRGYLVDKMCASNMIKTPNQAFEKASKHTRFCALEENCLASGYGILLKNGKYILFDTSGNKKAVELLRKTPKKNDLMVEIMGERLGEKINIILRKETK